MKKRVLVSLAVLLCLLCACTPAAPQESRLWWGLIDPEMSLWCAQLPRQESAPDSRILWDWSWRGFLAALFGIPVVEEVSADAAHA